MPPDVRERLRLRVAAQLDTLDRRGLSEATILAGAIGADARAIGGAALPLIKAFARDRELVFKDTLGDSNRAAAPPPLRRLVSVASSGP
jgi:hypothetical protein